MASLNELKSAIKDILQENGSLNKIRAEIREQIFKAIETDESPKPKIPEENLIINELIREYFNYMGYFHSSSVFLAESGHPEDAPVDRNFIAKELNIIEEKQSRSIPLIYSLLFGLKKESYEPMYNQTNQTNMNQISMNQNNLYNMTGQNTSKALEFTSKDQPKGIVFNN